MFVYVQLSEPDENGENVTVFTVGHYAPYGQFIPESDHATAEKAADRVAYLNGGE